jgi:hypothetical protein
LFGNNSAAVPQLVVGAHQVPGGAKFFNTVVEMADGALYFTDSCANYARRDVQTAIFDGRATGRLLKLYNNSVSVVAGDLSFANGLVRLDEHRLLVAATLSWRLFSFDVRTAELTVFANLPCYPDNLSLLSSRPLIAVGCGGGWRKPLLELLQSSPLVRKALLSFSSAQKLLSMVPLHPAVLLLDKSSGEVRHTWQDPGGVSGIEAVSEAVEFGEHIYLGSWRASSTLMRLSISAEELWNTSVY